MTSRGIRVRVAVGLAVGLTALADANPAASQDDVENPDPSAPSDPGAGGPEQKVEDELGSLAGNGVSLFSSRVQHS